MDQRKISQDYAALRRAALPLNSRLLKTLHKDEMLTAARMLGRLRGKSIELETEDESSVIVDYAIHNLYTDERNAVSRMLEDNPPPEYSIESRLLCSMGKSHYTIFEVEEPIPDFGVRGFDTTMNRSILIVDKGFSMTAWPGMMLGSRIYSPGEDWWMTTGAALPVTDEAYERICREERNHLRRFDREPTNIEWATLVTRECLASGASQHIGYVNIKKVSSQKPIAQTISTARKIGRNDPCPCGSGKKYKVCCAISG